MKIGSLQVQGNLNLNFKTVDFIDSYNYASISPPSSFLYLDNTDPSFNLGPYSHNHTLENPANVPNKIVMIRNSTPNYTFGTSAGGRLIYTVDITLNSHDGSSIILINNGSAVQAVNNIALPNGNGVTLWSYSSKWVVLFHYLTGQSIS